MNLLLLNIILFVLFLMQEFLVGTGILKYLDLIFSSLLLFSFFISKFSWGTWLSIIFWSAVVDSFSFNFPGPSIIGYTIGICISKQFKIHLDLSNLISFSFVFSTAFLGGEFFRLFFIPFLSQILFQEDFFSKVSISPGIFLSIFYIYLYSLGWGILCWFISRFLLERNFIVV